MNLFIDDPTPDDVVCCGGSCPCQDASAPTPEPVSTLTADAVAADFPRLETPT